MILLDTKAEGPKATLSQLLLGTKKGDSESFGKMLRELSLASEAGKNPAKEEFAQLLAKKGDDKGTKTQPGMLLKLDDPQKTAGKGETKPSLAELLHGNEKGLSELTEEEQHDAQLLHPKIGRTLPAQELRELIHNAKTYLKEHIGQIAEIKELPNTLKGLVELARKIGIDVEKITLEHLQAKSAKQVQQHAAQPDTLQGLPKAQTPVLKNNPTEHTTLELVQTKKGHQPNTTNDHKTEAKHEPLRSLLQTEQTKSKEGPQSERVQTATETLTTKPEQTAVKTANTPATHEQKAVTAARGDIQSIPLTKSEAMAEQPLPAQPKQPLFASALNNLLHGSSEEVAAQEGEAGPTEHKNTTNVSTVAKSEPIELKINEAKQMVRHFAGEIKEAIQNYKPPFTRIKLQLNPGKLGEVDVTMVQRGNNVHINISSNSAAINTLAQNATELRTQLSQNGLSNATMNFSSSSNPEQQQQQQRQHMAELYEQYEQYANSDEFEHYESLELIVPRYI